MMDDNSYNFYDVVKEAEKYFATHDKGRGSGYKGYIRWKEENEDKYFPSGRRDNIDPFFAVNAYKTFVRNNPQRISRRNSNGWKEIGPSRVDSITSNYNAGLGRIEDFYVDPTDSNKIYLGSRSGGFWRSVDGGASWEVTTDFLLATGVNTIAVSPTNPDSVLINLKNAKNDYSHGIYRSIDGGLTWTLSNFNPTNVGYGGLGSDFKIRMIKYHPRVPDLIFIGTNKGIFRSVDNLSTWTRLYSSGDITEIEFHPANDSIIYIYDGAYSSGHNNVVLRSLDQGLSYSPSNTVVGNNNTTSVYFAVSPLCKDCLYWASKNGVWISKDTAKTFTFRGNSTQACKGFAINRTDTSKMIYGYVDIDRSIDGGRTWINATKWSLGSTNGAGNGNQASFETSTNYVHADLRRAKFIDGTFYVGTDGFLSKSTDNGVHWTILSQGVATRENYTLGLSQSNSFRSISGSQDNGTSIKHRSTWLEFYGADGTDCLIHPLNDNWMIASVQRGTRKRTLDGGQTLTGVNPSGAEPGSFLAPIFCDPNDHMSIYDFRRHIYKSTDFASTYDSIGSPSGFYGAIRRAAIAENNSKIIVVSYYANIEKSIDGGVSFKDIRKNNLPYSSIKDIAFDPNDDDTFIIVYASYENDGKKVFKTTDGGDTWINITNNLGNIPVYSVAIDHTSASNIYIGTELGVYTKPMDSNNWVLYNEDLPNCAIQDLEINYGTNTIKAATWGRGMWECALVDRNDFPQILKTEINDLPTFELPKEGFPQYVTSVVKYDNQLSGVYVKWSEGSPTFDNIIVMKNAFDSIWISDQPLDLLAGDTVYFKVYAVGIAGDTSETYKFNYKVKAGFDTNFCMDLVSGSDDVEEKNGSVNNYSSDLELCYDGAPQYIGIRFVNIQIPKNSIIDSAYLEFMADESDNGDVVVNIAAYDIADAPEWGGGNYVSTRPQTDAKVIWNFDSDDAWIGGVTVDQTPNLKDIVQEIIDIPDWKPGNNMSFILYGDGVDTDKRVAESKNGSQSPKLCVEFSLPQTDCSIVTNTYNAGPGSLRFALNCVSEGDTIRFSPDIFNDTIVVLHESLRIDKSIFIESNANEGIVIRLGDKSKTVNSVFDIEINGNPVGFTGFTIMGADGPNGSAILNSGNLTLKNMMISKAGKPNIVSTIKNYGGGTISIVQNASID